MSKNIVIKTNGTANTYSVDRLNTALADDSARDQDWEFEAEDTSDYVKMTVGENGEYNAEDYGAKAITEVEVTDAISGVETEETELELEERTPVITVGGKARIMGGVKKLRVNDQNGDALDLIPMPNTGVLHAREKGVYSAVNDGYEGYSKVIVDVHDGGDWSGLPDEIRVTHLPLRMGYSDGEIIDYTGMEVTAYRNNEIWRSPLYPDGIIPFEELIVPERFYRNELYYNSDVLEGTGFEKYGIKISDNTIHTHFINVNNIMDNPIDWKYDSNVTWRVKDDAAIDLSDVVAGQFVFTNAYYNPSLSGVTYYFIVYVTKNQSPGVGTYTFADCYGESIYTRYNADGSISYTQTRTQKNKQTSRIDGSITTYTKAGQRYNSTFFGSNCLYASAYWGHVIELDSDDIDKINYTDKLYPYDYNYMETSFMINRLAWTMKYGDLNVKIQWKRPKDGQSLYTMCKVEQQE